MATPVTIKIQGAARGDAIARAAARLKDLQRPLAQIGQWGLRHSRERLRNRIQNPGRSSGMLAKSGHVVSEPNAVSVGYARVYARIQQLGGVVRPKGHPYLTIPVPEWLAKSGKWAREWPRGSLKFVKRTQITLFGSTWYGPALVANDEKSAEERDTKLGAIQRKMSKAKARDKKRYGAISGTTQRIEALRMLRVDLMARGKKIKGSKANFGEVMYALVKKARIPGDPYLTWDTPWQTAAHDILARWVGIK